MLSPSAKKFFQCGLLIAAAEEFITQGVLSKTWFLWVFTLIPFAVFLLIAWHLRARLNRWPKGGRAALLYYLVMGDIGLSVEWFVIGLSPWRDPGSPLLPLVLFHAGMFSFWGTVAMGPHLWLDQRPETARIRRWFFRTLAVLMAMTYVLTFTALAIHADHGTMFNLTIWPVVVTFLTMNLFYAFYFRACEKAVHLAQTPASTP